MQIMCDAQVLNIMTRNEYLKKESMQMCIERNVDIHETGMSDAIMKWKETNEKWYGWQEGDTDMTAEEAADPAFLPIVVDAQINVLRLREQPKLTVMERLMLLKDWVEKSSKYAGLLAPPQDEKTILREKEVFMAVALRRALYHGLHPHLNDRFVNEGDTLLTHAAYLDTPLFRALINLPQRFGLNVNRYGDRGTAVLWCFVNSPCVCRDIIQNQEAILSLIARTSDFALRLVSGGHAENPILHACIRAMSIDISSDPITSHDTKFDEMMCRREAFYSIWNVLLDRADDDGGGGVYVLQLDGTRRTALEYYNFYFSKESDVHVPVQRLIDADGRARAYLKLFPQAVVDALQGHALRDVHELLTIIRSYSAAVTPICVN